MNIIEKLGIEQIEAMSIPYGEYGCEVFEVRKLETQRDDMIDCLIDLVIDGINDKYNEIHPRYSRSRSDEWILRHSQDFFEREIKLIESISGKTWEEVKELI